MLALPATVRAGDVLRLPTREGVTTTLFWQPAEAPRGTLLLFPGGDGGFGRVEDGWPQGRNFLVRSARFFSEAGFNVAIFGRPSDSNGLDYPDRIAEAHLSDVARVVAELQSRSAAPLWLVGTSRGTVSATAAAIRLQDRIAGLVLSASVVSPKKPGAVPTQDLAAIRVPVLLLHHAKDACGVCDPKDVPAILRGLTQAPAKQLVMVDGGADPTGDACEALHWHGFVGMEREAVRQIVGWMAKLR